MMSIPLRPPTHSLLYRPQLLLYLLQCSLRVEVTPPPSSSEEDFCHPRGGRGGRGGRGKGREGKGGRGGEGNRGEEVKGERLFNHMHMEF